MVLLENIVPFLAAIITVINGQNMPVFMGQNNNPNARPNFGTTNQFRPPNRGPPFRTGPGSQFPGPGPMGQPRMPGGPLPRNGIRPGMVGARQFSAPAISARPMQPVGPGPARPVPGVMPVGPGGPVGPVRSPGPLINQQQQQQQIQQQEQSRWAPGEPKWVFPSTPEQWRNSCQRTGCPGQGTQCVFWGGLCPTSVRRTPCRCERGCKVDDVFIPFGQSRRMDDCNNVCACYSREGLASCTARRC